MTPVKHQRVVMVTLVILGSVLGVSHAGAFLVWQDAFRPWLALAAGALATLLLGGGAAWWALRVPLAADYRLPRRVLIDLMILLAVALVFRASPLPNYAGGRDDGVYTSLAAHLTRATSTIHQDPTVRGPVDDGRELYGDLRVTPRHDFARQPTPDRAGRVEGDFLPGVYIADARNLTYVFQFLHVHPVWMSIAAAGLGPANMNWAVIAFGVLSVLAVYLVLHGLTASRGWSLTGGLLLAVNPLHAFFSRNALSEPTALFFLLACLLMMVWGWRLATCERQRWIFGGLAAASFSAYCLTRIDGFFFLPFAVLATAYLLVGADGPRMRRPLVGSLALAVAAYAVSVAYLRATSYPYAVSQYGKIFAPLLGEQWTSVIGPLCLATGAVVAALLAGLWLSGRIRRLGVRARGWLGPALSLVMLVALAVHVVKVWRLATGDVDDQIGYVARFDLAGQGWFSVRHSSLVNLVVYLSPPLVLLAALELLRWRDRDHARTLALVLVTGYLVYGAVLQWVLPFQFYYGRYLLSGLLPAALLLVILGLHGRRWRRWITVPLMGLAFAWCAVASATQFIYTGYDDLVDGLSATAEGIGPDDLVLWDVETCDRRRYQTPLIYVFDLNVWTFHGRDGLVRLLDRADLLDRYDEVYVISGNDDAPACLQRIDAVDFRWRGAKRDSVMPLREHRYHDAYTRYRLERRAATAGEVVYRDRAEERVGWAEGMHGARTWTTGRAVFHFRLDSTAHRHLDIELHGWRPRARDDDLAAVVLILNDRRLDLTRADRKGLSADVTPDMLVAGDNTLTVEVATFVPADVLADSRDDRALGLDVETITFR